MSLCEAERTFILHGVEEDFRLDGRQRGDYRPMELETNVVEHAFGSARLRLANTDILVAVKIEIDTPFPEQPDEGKLEFFVDCSANATPDFEGRGGEDLATEIANSLNSAYKSARALDLTKLCIYKNHKCWKIYVDILILECGGNLYDAISLAVKAALYNTKIPKIKSVTVDGNNIEIDISDNLSEYECINISNIPIMVTLCKIGEHFVVDPSNQEECCTNGSILISLSGNMFTSVNKNGSGSFRNSTLIKSLNFVTNIARDLNNALLKALTEEAGKKTDCVGFLK